MTELDVPEPVQLKARALGVDGEAWLRSLAELVRGLEQEWQVEAGEPILGGTESYVATATTHDGVPVVLKVQMPCDGSFPVRVRTLASAGGHGYVRLLRSDEARRAMLLERLGSPLAVSGLSVVEQIEILCATLAAAWGAAADRTLDTGADKAERLAGFIHETWEALGRTCSEVAIERALGFAAARAAAFDPAAAVVVHGDAHAWNALRGAGDDGYRFVDPESFLAERAYDLGISLREWSAELLAGDALEGGLERCHLLARLAGVAPQPVWEWGFAERVSTGLLALQVGYEHAGREMLAVADVWSSVAGPGLDGRLAPR